MRSKPLSSPLVYASDGPSDSSLTIVPRYRTALTRDSLSRPIKLAVEDGVLHTGTQVFDYGCGRGDDLRILSSQGIVCAGWDPAFSGSSERREADIVNLGYV